MAVEMKSTDEEMQVFIERLWCELREIEGARPVLRGTVEHVTSGERRSVKGLGGICWHFSSPFNGTGLDLAHGLAIPHAKDLDGH